jgi:hypothetical protein
MVLALDLGQRIADRAEEIVVGVENDAVEGELDDRLRLADGRDLPGAVGYSLAEGLPERSSSGL